MSLNALVTHMYYSIRLTENTISPSFIIILQVEMIVFYISFTLLYIYFGTMSGITISCISHLYHWHEIIL